MLYVVTILLLILAAIMRWMTPKVFGMIGESYVGKRLNEFDERYYKILKNLMLPSAGNTDFTQIDHVIVSNFGIFCIETKSYRGWIYGHARYKYWTQVIYKNKYKFYNPLWQNYAHIKAIEIVLGADRLKASIVSLVAFPDAGKIKVTGTDVVGNTSYAIGKILRYNTLIYSDHERDEMYELLQHANVTNKNLRRLHNKKVKSLKVV